MSKRKIENCPLCQEDVSICISEGGGDETLMYSASCKNCGILAENLSFNKGTRSSAISEWNRAKKAYVKIEELKQKNDISWILKAQKRH